MQKVYMKNFLSCLSVIFIFIFIFISNYSSANYSDSKNLSIISHSGEYKPNKPSAKQYRVGVLQKAPFGTYKNDIYDGISVNIWHQIAEALSLNYKFIPLTSGTTDALNKLKEKKIDVLLGDIAVKSNLLKDFDFSRPYYIDRLSMVGIHKKEHFLNIIIKIGKEVFSSYILFSLILILLFACGVCYAERKRQNEMYEGHFAKSFLMSIYETIVCFFGQNDMPYIKTALSRLVCALCLILSVFLCSIIVGVITTSLTISSSDLALSGDVIDFSTLYNKPVIVIEDSYAESVASKLGANIMKAKSLSDAIALFKKHPEYKIIDGYLALKYYFMEHPSIKLGHEAIGVGSSEIAFAFNKDSPIVLPVNIQLTHMQEYSKAFETCRRTLSLKDSIGCEV